MIKALIFDVDGTLAETERDAHRVAFNETFAACHLDWHWNVTLYGELLAVTGGKERMIFYRDHYDCACPKDLDIIALHKMKTARYNDMLARRPIPLRPGVRRLLEEARSKDMRLAIATTTTLNNVTTLLTHSLSPNSASWFEVIAAGDMVSAKKPAPDIYLYVLKKMGLLAEQCVAIEDSKNGHQSALAAHIPTLITVSDYTRHEDFTGAQLILNHLGEPEQAFTILSDNTSHSSYVDVDMLRGFSK